MSLWWFSFIWDVNAKTGTLHCAPPLSRRTCASYDSSSQVYEEATATWCQLTLVTGKGVVILILVDIGANFLIDDALARIVCIVLAGQSAVSERVIPVRWPPNDDGASKGRILDLWGNVKARNQIPWLSGFEQNDWLPPLVFLVSPQILELGNCWSPEW